MRPRGSYGDVAEALIEAARSGPGRVRELAQRAQVGYDAARYTSSRLVAAGVLMVVDEDRPATLAVSTPSTLAPVRTPVVISDCWQAEI